MAWVSRLHFRTWSLNLRWLGETFPVALGQACHFSTVERCWHVSSHGRCRDTRGRLTLGSLHPMGYRCVRICGQRFLVHRVVAFAFLGPPTQESAWQVHHRDGDRLNNKLENLTYVTNSENVQSSYDNNPARGTGVASRSKPVMWRKLAISHMWNTCSSITVAARELGASPQTISQCCRQGLPLRDYQLRFRAITEPDFWPGEKWLPMKNPSTGHVITGREVSSFGRIKSRSGLVTQGHQTLSGYFCTAICTHSTTSQVQVHRLVAYAFLGPPPTSGHTQVNHKDLNPGNNRIENLEYVTPSENVKHFFSTLASPQRKPGMGIPVFARPYGSKDAWVKYPSMIIASKLLGISHGGISRCARGLVKRAGTHEFRQAEATQPDHFPGEEWRAVDFNALLREKMSRTA